MYKLLEYIFGYRKIKFLSSDTETILNFLYEYRITSWGYFQAEDDFSYICISNADYKYFLDFKTSLNSEVEISEIYGLPQIFKKYKKRIGIWVGLFFFSLILLISSLFVWEVRIIGAYNLNENEIIENLRSEGLHIGTFIPKIKSTEICNSYMKNYGNVAWMSINTKGNVVNVEIIEAITDTDEKDNEKGKYANLVASEDAVIEKITLSRGNLITATGKTVKKGDMLISGVYESPRKYSFVYASGEVIGRVDRTVSVEIPFSYTEKEYKKSKITEFYINFFGFEINIFRYSGKMPAKYDTIYKREQIAIFDKIKLPIFVNKTVCSEYEHRQLELSMEQAVSLAFVRLKSELMSATSDCELISKNIVGQLTESSYILTCNAVCVKDIAIPLEFNLN